MVFQKGSNVYFVGIKGTGMSALAELLRNAGLLVSGSDTPEIFYTDQILKDLNIPYFENFSKEHISTNIDLLIHSAAYNLENPEIAEAKNLNIPILKYTAALGAYSEQFDSSGIAGVHGKTTTTAVAGTLIKAVNLPAQILAGSAVNSFGGKSTLSLGNKYFIAETCEYRKHFLDFHPKRIVLTSVEEDHQDFFPTYKSILDAFLEYCRKLPQNGELIYCADNKGSQEVAEILKREGKNIKFTPYGFNAEGDFQISSYKIAEERVKINIKAFPNEFKLQIPGKHNALNVTAALALTDSLIKNENPKGFNEKQEENIRLALEDFKGSKRRCEILGETKGILFIDDYAHHPTAIRATLSALKEFYPKRRIVVSFMSHTYTRTASLLDEFASSFENADLLILHKIYSSAREEYSGGVNGKTLFEKAKSLKDNVYYIEEPMDTLSFLKNILKEGDIFITMGAGNNWIIGTEYLKSLQIDLKT